MTLSELKKLAGINEFKGYVKYDPVDPYGGSNISITGDEKGQLQKNITLSQVVENGFNYGLVYHT